MNRSKKTRIVSLLALVLCMAMAATFVLAFTACDEENASADSGLTWGQEHGYVMGGGSIRKNWLGDDVYEEMPETLKSEIVDSVFVENPNVEILGEFDKNGLAPCTYYNTKQNLIYAGLSGYGCVECGSEKCRGHAGYVCRSGYAQSDYFYPYTIAPISSTVETPEIQCTLIFRKEPEVDGSVFSDKPQYMALSSLNGEVLDVASVTMVYVLAYDNNGTCDGYGYEANDLDEHDPFNMRSLSTGYFLGAEKDALDCFDITIAPVGKYCVFTVELANGDEYEYGVESNTYHFLEETKEDIEIEDGNDMSAA